MDEWGGILVTLLGYAIWAHYITGCINMQYAVCVANRIKSLFLPLSPFYHFYRYAEII